MLKTCKDCKNRSGSKCKHDSNISSPYNWCADWREDIKKPVKSDVVDIFVLKYALKGIMTEMQEKEDYHEEKYLREKDAFEKGHSHGCRLAYNQIISSFKELIRKSL